MTKQQGDCDAIPLLFGVMVVLPVIVLVSNNSTL